MFTGLSTLAKLVATSGLRLGKNSGKQGFSRERRNSRRNPKKWKNPNKIGGFIGGQGRDRTGDTRIFSPLLYQLSYLATHSFEMVGAQGFEPWTQ